MNFTHLHAFHAVALCGSVSAGATRLHVSQPAVTREIRELEERLNVTLFDRQPRGVTLTEAGRLLFDYAEQIFALAERAESDLRELTGLSAGKLTVGASLTVGTYLLPDCVAAFHQRYPAIALRLSLHNTSEVEAGLISGEFGLGFIEGPFDSEHFDAIQIGSDQIAAIVRTGHPLLNQTVTAQDLACRTAILREPDSGTRSAVDMAYTQLGLVLEARLAINHTEAIKRLLVHEPAVAFLSLLSVRDEIRRGDLAVLPVPDLHIMRDLYMIWLKRRQLSDAALAFSALVSARDSTPQ